MEHNFIVRSNRIAPNYSESYSNRTQRYRLTENDFFENDEDYGYGYHSHINYFPYMDVEGCFLREMDIEAECYED